MPRKVKAAPGPQPCRGLSIGEACALLLVRSEWQTFDELQATVPTLPRYELRGFLGVLGVLALIDVDGRRYRLRPGDRTETAVAGALATLQAAS